MPGHSHKQRPQAHDIAAEIIRRSAVDGGGHVVRVSRPPTCHERLQLLAARLERRPIVIMPHRCRTVEEWLKQYDSMKGS